MTARLKLTAAQRRALEYLNKGQMRPWRSGVEVANACGEDAFEAVDTLIDLGVAETNQSGSAARITTAGRALLQETEHDHD